MERAFHADLSQVRAWTGRGSELAGLGAFAAASREEVAFRSATPDRFTVAHEVAHVLQFRNARPVEAGVLPRTINDCNSAAEREATLAGTLAGAGIPVEVRASATAAVHRIPEDLAPGQEPRRTGITQAVVPVTAIDPANEKHARRIRSAIVSMAMSSSVIGRNTAHRVLDGDITVRLIEDLVPHPDQAAVLTTGGMSPDDVKNMLRNGVVYDVPGGNAPKYIPHTAHNFYAQEITNTVFIRSASNQVDIQTGLEHETSHALNPDWSTPEQLFDTEARAYYVAEMSRRGGSDVRELITFAKKTVLERFPDLNRRYNDETDPAFKAYVDNWEPTGNLVNAPETP